MQHLFIQQTCTSSPTQTPQSLLVLPVQVINDGVSIARAIELADPVENAGAQLIKEVRPAQQHKPASSSTRHQPAVSANMQQYAASSDEAERHLFSMYQSQELSRGTADQGLRLHHCSTKQQLQPS
jgi:hypothetical protein